MGVLKGFGEFFWEFYFLFGWWIGSGFFPPFGAKGIICGGFGVVKGAPPPEPLFIPGEISFRWFVMLAGGPPSLYMKPFTVFLFEIWNITSQSGVGVELLGFGFFFNKGKKPGWGLSAFPFPH